MSRLVKLLFVATALVVSPLPAFAQVTPAESAALGDLLQEPGALPPLTLMKGRIVVGGETVNIGLSEPTFKPISIAPSIWYGVSDKLTVGVTHDGGSTMWTPRPGSIYGAASLLGQTPGGVCLTGKTGDCPKVYNNISMDALFRIRVGKLSLAGHPAVDLGSFDPLGLSLRVGALGTYAASDKVTVAFDPRLMIGITDRDRGNKEAIDFPVWVWHHLNEKIGTALNTGVSGPLDGFGDAFRVPVGFNFTYKANEKLTVGGDFSFVNLIGKNGGADGRMLGVRAQYGIK